MLEVGLWQEKLRNHCTRTSHQSLNSLPQLLFIQLFFLIWPLLPSETGSLLSRAAWHLGMACTVRGCVVWVCEDFILPGYWRNKFQTILQTGARSFIFVMHRERRAVHDIHCVSLCKFVHLGVARSKELMAVYVTMQNVYPLTGIAQIFFSPHEISV